ncbi:hypothetical protein [Rhodopirellula sallentina]|uniref:hypothetical protein n=1 Tax=Rhodopirellula sallentina TaxID=1263869 RepID=UPI0003493AFC|nr:hypothetical protein [Rhodopirellula sallentina]
MASFIAVGVAAYAVWKPTTTSADLPFLSSAMVVWLDHHGDFRTMLMSMAVCSIPAMAMFRPSLDTQRRCVLFIMMSVMLVLEYGQRWIPTRGFSIADLIYTVLGTGCIELGVLLVQVTIVLKRAHFGEDDWGNA